jgi:hypothetical protein
MSEHHHNMRLDELPQEPIVARPAVDDRHGNANSLRLGALIVLLPAIAFALVSIGDSTAGGGMNAIVPVLLLLASAVMFRRARELDPDDSL